MLHSTHLVDKHSVGTNLVWFGLFSFSIDRKHTKTHTPRNNQDIHNLERQLQSIKTFGGKLRSYVARDLYQVSPHRQPQHSATGSPSTQLTQAAPVLSHRQAGSLSEEQAHCINLAASPLLCSLQTNQPIAIALLHLAVALLLTLAQCRCR